MSELEYNEDEILKNASLGDKDSFGQLYERYGEKAGLARRYLSEVLKVQELPDRSLAFARLTEMLGQTPAQVTQLLWDRYDPSQVWTPFAVAGILAAVAMYAFIRLARRWQDVNA